MKGEMTAPSNLGPAVPAIAPEADGVPRPFLEAADEERARRQLGEILEREAAPVAREVIRSHLRGRPASDLEDVRAGVLLRLAAHLRSLRRGGDGRPIRNVASYAAAVSHNACHAFLRERCPERARLRSRTRYVLTRDSDLALWTARGQELVCGKAAWRDAPCEPAAGPRLLELSRRLGAFVDGERGVRALPFPELVAAVVERLPGPARFEDLVDAIAAIQGLSDRPERTAREDADGYSAAARDIADPASSPEAALVQRQFLSRLWSEIRLLPAGQRAALLLNLRDADGRGMIGLLPLTGTATLPEIAQVLDISEERLRALWDELPRDDEWIAHGLSVTRRQVINLRKCARERLARRLRGRGNTSALLRSSSSAPDSAEGRAKEG